MGSWQRFCMDTGKNSVSKVNDPDLLGLTALILKSYCNRNELAPQRVSGFIECVYLSLARGAKRPQQSSDSQTNLRTSPDLENCLVNEIGVGLQRNWRNFLDVQKISKPL